MWEVFINGVSQAKLDSLSTINCTYYLSYMASSDSFSTPSQNLTVLVHGRDISETAAWSLEFNELLINEQTVSSTSARLTQNPALPTGLNSAAGRARLYRPLLVFGGILVAVIYWV